MWHIERLARMLPFQDADQSSKFFYDNATTVVPVVLGKNRSVLSQMMLKMLKSPSVFFLARFDRILHDYVRVFTRDYKNLIIL